MIPDSAWAVISILFILAAILFSISLYLDHRLEEKERSKDRKYFKRMDKTDL